MRFKSSIRNISTFTKLTASLASLGKVAWLRLDNDSVRFTVIPEKGSQVWAVLAIDTVFDDYTIQSATERNTINLELPIDQLHRALRSALSASSASIRLTKKDNCPVLSLTIISNTFNTRAPSLDRFNPTSTSTFPNQSRPDTDSELGDFPPETFRDKERETVITQDVPVRVLPPTSVDGIHEPRCREPDVHILLPPLAQLKAISERFTKLSASSSTTSALGSAAPKLELAANAHGCLKLGSQTDSLKISSLWKGLANPQLDPAVVEGGEEAIAAHPSTRLKLLGDEDGLSDEGWAKVRIDGKDWGKVLNIGRVAGKVIACIAHEAHLVLYVYLSSPSGDPDEEEEESAALTYYITSYSA